MRSVWVVLAPIGLIGCTTVRSVSHESVRDPVSQAHRIPAMERQVVNAVDAGEGDSVVRELRRRLTSNPDDVPARLELAARYEVRGYPELAIEHLRLAAARAPHLSEIQIHLAKTLHAAAMNQDAIAVLASFCERESAPPVELVSLQGIYTDELERYSEAEVYHRAALALAPHRESLHNNLGYNLMMQGRMAEAVTSFRAAVALNPRSEIARNNLGTALASLPGADLKEAVLQWQSVSDPATAHSNLASVLIEQKRYGEARQELQIAIGYSRNHPAALNNLALLGELEGKAEVVNLPEAAGSWKRFTARMREALTGKPSTSERSAEPAPVEAAAKQQ